MKSEKEIDARIKHDSTRLVEQANAARVLGIEAHAEALLKRVKRHNGRNDPLTEFEISSVLKEIYAIVKMNLVGSLPDDVLARVNRILQQAVQEARTVAAKSITQGRTRGGSSSQ